MNRSKNELSCQKMANGAQKSHLLRTRLGFVSTLLGLIVLWGCKTDSGEKGDSALREEGKAVFKPSDKPADKSAGSALDETGTEAAGSAVVEGKWTIVLLRLRGSERDHATQTVLKSVRASGLPEAFLETRSDATLVVIGNYESASSPDARAMLKRVKEMEVNGAKPYFGAHFLPPPAATMKGSIPEWDLRNAKENFGKQAEYTLQINIYTNPRGTPTAAEVKEFQKAAEDAVRTLRKEGVDAFYFHDMAGSTVTVGLFSQKELDGAQSLKPGGGNNTLTALQKQFPNAMINGAGVKDHAVDAQGRPTQTMRPSFIVRVPS